MFVSLLLVLTGVCLSAQAGNQAIRESGPELGEVSLVPALLTETSAKASPVPASPTAAPVRVVIRSLGVNAPIESVGIVDGAQDVPESFSRVGWWKDGQRPGQPGNTVITGHTWSKGDGVFDQLPKLGTGDVIELKTEKGLRTYRVRSVGSVSLDRFEAAAGEIYRSKGSSGLVLMTCGDWDGSAYNATTVVYAELTH